MAEMVARFGRVSAGHPVGGVEHLGKVHDPRHVKGRVGVLGMPAHGDRRREPGACRGSGPGHAAGWVGWHHVLGAQLSIARRTRPRGPPR